MATNSAKVTLMNGQDAIIILRQNADALRARGVLHAALFGSRARGDAHAVKLFAHLLHELVHLCRDLVFNVTSPAEGGTAVFVEV